MKAKTTKIEKELKEELKLTFPDFWKKKEKPKIESLLNGKSTNKIKKAHRFPWHLYFEKFLSEYGPKYLKDFYKCFDIDKQIYGILRDMKKWGKINFKDYKEVKNPLYSLASFEPMQKLVSREMLRQKALWDKKKKEGRIYDLVDMNQSDYDFFINLLETKRLKRNLALIVGVDVKEPEFVKKYNKAFSNIFRLIENSNKSQIKKILERESSGPYYQESGSYAPAGI